MKDYRPISCCNVLYKIISKILANRLKTILPDMISSSQSAFVRGRLLMENVLLASELVKDYHKTDISSRCALKIDISKAFDSLDWPFLLDVLAALDIPPPFIHWIRLCVTTASFSVQVNGELAGYFGSSRGLRQGCALSPYLFVICLNVFSAMLDKAAINNQIGYHPKCRNLNLTHLCFADDMLLFTNGTLHSITEILRIFDRFSDSSGLRISLEKSTLFLTGVSQDVRQHILTTTTLSEGSLPVRYLGLPLLTRRMTSSDYEPLIEKITNRISSWTARYLSYAGRLQLISSLLMSLTNFWMSAFRLPKACTIEIERICSAFLWSGPDLNPHKAKVAWSEVCRPKKEGGLGLRPLTDSNRIACLKLVWRIISHTPSLWTTWIWSYMIPQENFWTIIDNSSAGSWMWRKLLKYREISKPLHRISIKNGAHASFWFDDWCGLGRLSDLVNSTCYIDMGIPKNATVEAASARRRCRSYRHDLYSMISEELHKLVLDLMQPDIHLWKHASDSFKPSFSTKNTYNQLRAAAPSVPWYHFVWFHYNTPKFSFISWLAVLGRLSTGDRMKNWNRGYNPVCVLCGLHEESRDHLFFACRFSSTIWRNIGAPLLRHHYTEDWTQIQLHLTYSRPKTQQFLIHYAYQSSIYHIWRERNTRRNEDRRNNASLLIKFIDKNIRNKLTAIQQTGDTRFQDGFAIWFATRT